MLTRGLLALLLLLPATTHPTAGLRQAAPPRVIEITAARFEFWPSEIRVREGEAVQLRISSEDTLHGFRIVGGVLNLAVPKRGRGEAVAMLPPLRAGRYTIECSRMCGAGHNFMRATLVVSAPGSGQ
jgi:cytochrome c oxidase subunit 2